MLASKRGFEEEEVRHAHIPNSSVQPRDLEQLRDVLAVVPLVKLLGG